MAPSTRASTVPPRPADVLVIGHEGLGIVTEVGAPGHGDRARRPCRGPRAPARGQPRSGWLTSRRRPLPRAQHQLGPRLSDRVLCGARRASRARPGGPGRLGVLLKPTSVAEKGIARRLIRYAGDRLGEVSSGVLERLPGPLNSRCADSRSAPRRPPAIRPGLLDFWTGLRSRHAHEIS